MKYEYSKRSYWIFCWEFIQLALLVLTLGLVGLELGSFDAEAWLMNVWDLLLSVIFLIDSIVFHRKSVVRARGMLLAEFISIVPFRILLIQVISAYYLPVVFLFRMARIPLFVMRYRSHQREFGIFKHFKLVSGAILAVFGIHTIACGWLLVYPPQSGMDALTAYNRALYWTVTTLTTVGYGDITPVDNWGRGYALTVMLTGVSVFALIISQFSSAMLKRDRRKELVSLRLEGLSAFFRHYEVPGDLQSHVYYFYQHVLNEKAIEDERKIISELPPVLQGKLQVYMNLKPLSKLMLFHGCSLDCLQSVVKSMEQVHYSPNEVIIRKGETGQEMFLIGYGDVRVHDGEQSIAVLGEGQCFGEMSLLETGIRIASVTADTYCDLLKLSKEKFLNLIEEYPELKKNVAKVIDSRRSLAS